MKPRPNLPAKIEKPTRGQLAQPIASGLLDHFVSRYSGATLDAYRRDIDKFCAFLGMDSAEEAAEALVRGGRGAANNAVLSWRSSMIEDGLSPKTINRRLSAIRSMVKQAKIMGLVEWSLDIKGVKDYKTRDPRGPGRPAFDAILQKMLHRTDAAMRRDVAILLLLHDVALRRGEVSKLDLDDYDFETGTLRILGKGRLQKQEISLPSRTAGALDAWIENRGGHDGPMFLSMDLVHKGSRLTPQSIYNIVRAAGEAVGVQVRPHGLRHTAITTALDRTGGDVRSVAQFARHTDVRVTMQYDDARQERAKKVADIVSRDEEEGGEE